MSERDPAHAGGPWLDRSSAGAPVARDLQLIDAHRVGPFVTSRTYRTPDGSSVTWTSRRHRKGLGLAQEIATRPRRWLALTWAPTKVTWWTAVLFMIGSACFVVGSFPPYVHHVSVHADALTYFVGSIFFTSAGYLQFLEVSNADRYGGGEHLGGFRFASWQPTSIGWWSAAVQSFGTLLFNVSTFAATRSVLDQQQSERLVWAPDMLGSVAFLIASTLAWVEVCEGWWRVDPHDVSWWIVALNLIGSIAFQLSALGAFISPKTGEVANLPVATAGTFIGAVCFFLGAYLLLPEIGSDPAGDRAS